MMKRTTQLKILILGSELSGKTTFFKQMQLGHGTKPSISERKCYSLPIIRAIFLGIQRLIKVVQLRHLGKKNNLFIPIVSNVFYRHILYKNIFSIINLITEYENSELKAKEHEIMTLDVNTMEEFENRHFEIVKNLCDDLAIATTFSEEKERLVENNLDYFLRHIDRIFEPNYIPTQEDILHVYIPTKRTIEYVLDKDKMKLGYI